MDLESTYANTIDVFNNAFHELLMARDLNTVSGISKKVMRKLSHADGASFILKEENHIYYYDEEAIGPLFKGSRFPIDKSIEGLAISNREVVVVEDIYTDNRIPWDTYKSTFVKSIAVFPIRKMDPLGAIGVYWKDQYKEVDVGLLQSFADITAVTLENIKIFSDLNNRLAKRTKQLESIINELESFTFSVSHSLKAPLRSITGYCSILEEDYIQMFEDKARQIFNIIKQNALRMHKQIDRLNDFAKIVNRELDYHIVNMQALLEGVVKSLSYTNHYCCDIKIKEIHPAFCDYLLMKEVWINLLSNAMKYSSKRQRPEIEISSVVKDNEIIYSIKDNGIGFNMNYADKLFNVYQRLHKESEFEGIGVGLSIVKRIINLHGGRIWAEAKVDEGATFFFSLPETMA